MRLLVLIAATLSLAAASAAVDAQGRGHGRGQGSDQDAAFEAMQRGRIMPLPAILARVRIPGAQFIGADLDPIGAVYRLSFMRGGDVIRVFVDARTGRTLSISR